MFHACMYLRASTTRRYFDVDNESQVLLTFLSLLAAVVQLNSSRYYSLHAEEERYYSASFDSSRVQRRNRLVKLY